MHKSLLFTHKIYSKESDRIIIHFMCAVLKNILLFVSQTASRAEISGIKVVRFECSALAHRKKFTIHLMAQQI
jgi:hypothetical protein